MTVALSKHGTEVDSAPIGVVARDRAASAHQLQLAGHPWSVIAERVGYRTGKVASMAVTAYLQKTAVRQAPARRQQALELHLLRLDALQAAFWPQAISGNVKAAQLVMKVMSDRAKLLNFDLQPEPSAAERTLVIGGSSEDYVAQLRAFLEDDPQAIEEHWPASAYVDPSGLTHSGAALKAARPEIAKHPRRRSRSSS